LEGHLDVLKRLREICCPWDADTSLDAAQNDNLEVLNGLLRIIVRVTNGTVGILQHKEILKWSRANECPWGATTCSSAARNSELEVGHGEWANGRMVVHGMNGSATILQ